ncbi:hypothetical protein JHK86_015630 [Glycine max]|nr:hypothetical protein JHK86_015630 [Glycine max]
MKNVKIQKLQNKSMPLYHEPTTKPQSARNSHQRSDGNSNLNLILIGFTDTNSKHT